MRFYRLALGSRPLFCQNWRIYQPRCLAWPVATYLRFRWTRNRRLSQNFKKHPLVVFFAALIGCGLMEYLTAWYLETFKGLKWWDYSNVPFNLDGRICLISVVSFGLCGLAMTYLLYPVLIHLFNLIPFRLKKSLCIILVICFIGDFIYSSDVPNVGRGITDQLF